MINGIPWQLWVGMIAYAIIMAMPSISMWLTLRKIKKASK